MSDISDMMYEQGFHDGYDQALSELNSKKFEKVTRCKDCKHYDSETQSCLDGLDGIFQPDWYCADGEPKGGEVG